MKYIGFEVKPVKGMPVVIVRKFLNKEKGVPLNYTWHLRDFKFGYQRINADITSFEATHKDYANYQRRKFSSYARLVAELR